LAKKMPATIARRASAAPMEAPAITPALVPWCEDCWFASAGNAVAATVVLDEEDELNATEELVDRGVDFEFGFEDIPPIAWLDDTTGDVLGGGELVLDDVLVVVIGDVVVLDGGTYTEVDEGGT
jgi:hypothetical protein